MSAWWSRTQLGVVAEKTKNGHTLCYRVGYIHGGLWIRNIRAGLAFDTEDQARAFLADIESRYTREEIERTVIAKGELRSRR